MHYSQQAQLYIEVVDNSQQRERINVAHTRVQHVHVRRQISVTLIPSLYHKLPVDMYVGHKWAQRNGQAMH